MSFTTPKKPFLPVVDKNKIERFSDTTTYLKFRSKPKYRIIRLALEKYYIQIKTWYGWKKYKEFEPSSLRNRSICVYFEYLAQAEKKVIELKQRGINKKKQKKEVVKEFY